MLPYEDRGYSFVSIDLRWKKEKLAKLKAESENLNHQIQEAVFAGDTEKVESLMKENESVLIKIYELESIIEEIIDAM